MDFRAIVRVPVKSHRTVDVEAAGRAMQCVLDVVTELPEMFDLVFRIAAGNGEPTTAAFEIEGFDTEHAIAMAEVLRSVVHGFAPWIGLGPSEVINEPDTNDVHDAAYDVVPVAGPARAVLHHFGPTWLVAASLSSRTEMRLSIGKLTIETNEPVTLRCSIEILGRDADVSLVAAAFVSELPGSARYTARLRRNGSPRELTVPVELAGWLISSPARIRDAFPNQPIDDSAAVMAAFVNATPPHAAVFGGSGLGKTTFLEHRVAEAVNAGSTVVVLCPHGDLPVRVATAFESAGRVFDAIDFGDPDRTPRWSVYQPPTGVPVEEWVEVVPDITLARWREDGLNGQMAGPMWFFAFMAASGILARDPDGVWPVTDAVGILTEKDLAPRWSEVSDRIGDAGLWGRLCQARAAILGDKDQHFAPWVASKLQVFTSNSRVRAIVDHRQSSFDVARVFHGRSLLVSAPTAELGTDGASVILTGIMQQLWNVARRQRHASRREIVIVVDEAQLFDPPLMRVLLTQGRKFGIKLVVATQSPRNLDSDLLACLLANCGTIGTFRASAVDAALLDQRYPTVSVGAMQRLPKFAMAVSNGEQDLIGLTEPSLVDPDDVAAFARAHCRTMNAFNTPEQHVVITEPSQRSNVEVNEPTNAEQNAVDPLAALLDSWRNG